MGFDWGRIHQVEYTPLGFLYSIGKWRPALSPFTLAHVQISRPAGLVGHSLGDQMCVFLNTEIPPSRGPQHATTRHFPRTPEHRRVHSNPTIPNRRVGPMCLFFVAFHTEGANGQAPWFDRRRNGSIGRPGRGAAEDGVEQQLAR